ncbi:MAG TPA: hypothetical protein VMU63_09390 [Acidimicrobiales bacterium]|nr:hypothetical protein [Acidimicrobiales bacterium]
MSTSPFAQLHADWARLGATTTARRRLIAWVEAEPVLSGHGSPADLVGFAQRAEPDRRANIEAALLRLAGADSFAARALLQVLLARLVAQRLECRASLRGTEAVDDIRAELLSHLWEVIVAEAGADHGDPGRLLVDRAVSALRAQRRGARLRESRRVELASVPVATTELDDARTVTEQIVLAVTDAHRRGRLNARHARLLLLAAAGAPPRAVGTTAGPGLSRSVYYRLHLATAAMARAQA